jgi:KDO2-lipid IV(A) lauroyltransferase
MRKRTKNRKTGKSSLIRSFEIHAVYLLLRLWIVWVKRVPLESLNAHGEKLGTVGFHLLRVVRKIALHNLHLALRSERSEEELKLISRNAFKNIVKSMVELSRCPDYEDSYFKTLMRLEGKEYLDKALEQGKGVIAISAHLGNFPLMAVWLAKEGYPLSVVARISKNPKIVRAVTSYTDTIGLECIPDRPRMTCVARCIKALKEKRILMVHLDINAPDTEAWVDFFGYLVPTYKSPVVFSLRTGAPILPIFTVRNAHQFHTITIHPPFDPDIADDSQPDITSTVARLTKIIEANIREHLEDWWWLRPRFKRVRDIHTGERLFLKRP